jgi:hypothetical protein
VEDLHSRRIAGGSMGERVESRLVVAAPEMAASARLPGEGLVAHSGRGSQYAGEHYQRVPAGHGITCGMSRRANGWGNAPTESSFAALKQEPVHDEDYAAREEARAGIFEFIEVPYNRVRRHSALGYSSAIEYERAGEPLTPRSPFVGKSSPAGQRGLQRGGVEPREQRLEGAEGGGPAAVPQAVHPLDRLVAAPLGDGGVAAAAAEDRAAGVRQHGDQRVPPPVARAGVGDVREEGQQAARWCVTHR